MDLSLASPCSSSDSPDNQTTGSENSLVQGASTPKVSQANRAVDNETSNRCCRNGVKRTTFSAPVRHNRKFGGAKEEGYVVEDYREVLVVEGGTGDIEGVRRDDKGGIKETAGGGGGTGDDEDVTEGSEYNGGKDNNPSDVSGGKRKGKGGRRAKKFKKAKKDTPLDG
jgi:hypothetical protein